MIYTFKVRAPAQQGDPLETTHCTHGADVLAHAKALIAKHPMCDGVEVLVLGSRLFFMPRESSDAGSAGAPLHS